MRKRVGKRYLATLPVELHQALLEEARQHQVKNGGHLNINRVVVQLIFDSLVSRLTASEREAVKVFITSHM